MSEPVTRDSKVMAPARCTQKQATEYVFERMPVSSNYTRHDLENVIIPAYFTVGELIGVDPCIAIAQMIHETGFLSSFWSKRPRRNPAGIGVTGQTAKSLPKDASYWEWSYDDEARIWKKGLRFDTWDRGSVPGHISRLLGYATKEPERTHEQKEFLKEHTARRPLPPKVIGCAPTLAGLEGTWAVPGKGYADKLAAHATRMQTQE
jgi:hypothetical protein